MKTYSVSLPEVTADHIQVYLEQLYHDCRAKPDEIHIAEADYEPLVRSAIPDFKPDALHYDLMGKAWVEEQIAYAYHCRKRISGIVNFTTGTSMKLVKDATQRPGTIILYEREQNEESTMRQIDWYPVSSMEPTE